MLGLPAEAILADSGVFTRLIASEDEAELLRAKARVATGSEPSTIEIQIRKPDGEARWIRMTSVSRPASDGGRLLDGLIIDITEAKRLAEQLSEERVRLEQAIELTCMGVFRWDRDDPKTVLWSRHQYAIYGVPPQTPITVASFRDLVHPDDREMGRGAFAAALSAEDGGV
jgi:PAS domain S-box-containing protein